MPATRARVPLTLLLLSLAACQPPAPQPIADEVPPTPAPPFTSPIEQTPFEEVVAYARELKYDPRPGTLDSQRLMVGRYGADARYGPRVKIEVDEGAYLVDSTALAGGRVLARLVNGDSMPYPKLNIGPYDTVYVWIDRSDQQQWRAVLFSTAYGGKTLSKPLRINTHDHTRKRPWKESIARWVWSDDDEQLWLTCGRAQCCETYEP